MWLGKRLCPATKAPGDVWYTTVDPPGALDVTKKYTFNFSSVDKPHETYNGLNVRLRYLIRVTISRNYGNTVRECDFSVQVSTPPPELNSSIKMEVGIEECLHIEFEYDKQKYHLEDVIIGKVLCQCRAIYGAV